MERALVGSMIKTKASLGLGLKKTRKKSKWTDQLAEELHTNQPLENLEGGKFTLTASIRSELQIS